MNISWFETAEGFKKEKLSLQCQGHVPYSRFTKAYAPTAGVLSVSLSADAFLSSGNAFFIL